MMSLELARIMWKSLMSQACRQDTIDVVLGHKGALATSHPTACAYGALQLATLTICSIQLGQLACP